MRTVLILSAIVFSAFTAGCSTMTPEQQAAIPYRSYSPCGIMANHPKCYGQGSQSVKEIDRRKAYAADVLEREQRYRDATTRHDRDL